MGSPDMASVAASASLPEPHETVITADAADVHYWRDFWHCRELLGMMIWRDVIVRYKQTAMGLSWALVRPLATMLVFTFIFGRIANLPSEGVPYALLVFAGLLPWLFFSATFSDAGNSVLGNAHIVSKVYFPRLIIPVSAVAVGLVDFLLAFAVYVAMSLVFGHPPGWQIVLLPLYLLQLCVLILAFSLWVAALNVKYRDFRHLLPIVLQLGAYLSPVGFSSSVVTGKWFLIYALNPMVGVIDGFRWCLLGAGQQTRWEAQALSILVTLLVLLPGIRFFRRAEATFADSI